MQATGIILAGGKSSRMGQNKALLKIDGMTIIERIVEELGKIASDILIVTNTFEDYQFLNLPMTADKLKNKGPLAGIQAGLAASRNEKNLITACDMPFISAELGTILIAELDEYDAAVPEFSGRLHPLYAAYRRSTLQVVNEALAEEQLRIQHFLRMVHVKIMKEEELKSMPVEIDETFFFNMNHPDEFTQALKMRPESKSNTNDMGRK